MNFDFSVKLIIAVVLSQITLFCGELGADEICRRHLATSGACGLSVGSAVDVVLSVSGTPASSLSVSVASGAGEGSSRVPGSSILIARPLEPLTRELLGRSRSEGSPLELPQLSTNAIQAILAAKYPVIVFNSLPVAERALLLRLYASLHSATSAERTFLSW